jgi:1-acyl-sn-glycerol-3-phosphate acyltransferase
MHILITELVFAIPVVGRILRKAGQVRVVRANGREAFEEALALLRAGHSVTVFPEGALSPEEGSMHRLRNGVARLTLLTGAPVIPIGISLQRERIRFIDIARFYLRGPYAMTVGRPMQFSGDVTDRDQVVAVSERIRQRILSLSYQSAQRIEAVLPTGAGLRPVPWVDARG